MPEWLELPAAIIGGGALILALLPKRKQKNDE